MNSKRSLFTALFGLLTLALVVAACAQPLLVSQPGDEGGGDGESRGVAAEPAANLAFVDDVNVEERMGHQYAVVRGNYPDSCTRISDVQQDMEGGAIRVALLTAQPDGLVCAQMMSSFEVAILLELGGVEPGEYTVTVNDAASASFTIAL